MSFHKDTMGKNPCSRASEREKGERKKTSLKSHEFPRKVFSIAVRHDDKMHLAENKTRG